VLKSSLDKKRTTPSAFVEVEVNRASRGIASIEAEFPVHSPETMQFHLSVAATFPSLAKFIFISR